MKITIDTRMINSSGIGTYIKNLLPYITNDDKYKFLLISNNDNIIESNIGNFEFIKLKGNIFTAKEQLLYSLLIPKCDLFWSPNINIPLMPIRAKHRITTIHDVVHIAHPEFFNPTVVRLFRYFLKQATKKSDLLLTVSNFSKDEIIKYSNIDSKKIHVVYPAVDIKIYNNNIISEKEKTQLKQKYKLPERFLIYVGNIKPHKNLKNLLYAFDKIYDDSLYLVVVGNKEGFITMDKDIDNLLLNRNRKIIFTGFIPDKDLPKFYKMAKALIFPSIYEGFGLPPLEAQACGCPVIVSKIASLPEVYGDSALYCDPYDVNDIAEKIENLINNDELQAELKIRGLNNVKRFSWQNSAQKILSLFKEIL